MNKMIHCERGFSKKGFTLIELIIAMMVSAFVIAALYSAYVTQSRVYTSQEAVAEMQQNIRGAMVALSRDIRLAGYDTIGTAGAGFVDPVAGDTFSNGDTTPITEAVTTDATHISFTSDLDRDGTIDQLAQDIDGNGNFDLNEIEQISYRLEGTNLERYSTIIGGNEWEIIAEDILNLEFYYLDSSGGPTTNPEDITVVHVSILAQSNSVDETFENAHSYQTPGGDTWNVAGSNRRTRFLTTAIQCRNAGI